MPRRRATYTTKKGTYYGRKKKGHRAKSQKGSVARRTTKAEHKVLNTLSFRQRKAGHTRRKTR